MTVNTGTLSSGTVDNVQDTNTTHVLIEEVTGTPGFDVEFSFSGLTHIYGWSVKARYQGTDVHHVKLQIYNYDQSDWDDLNDIIDATRNLFYWYSGNLRDTDYISDGAAKVRLYHYSGGDATHRLSIDFVSLLGF